MTDIQTPAPAASRVTLDDVRQALGGTDPHGTNASKVRALLGNRGSYETIQRHLATLRAELAAAAAPHASTEDVPALPAAAAAAMWAAAWTAAQVQTFARAEKLAAERDAALLKLETMGQDLADLVQISDTLSGQIDQAATAAAAAAAAHAAQLADAEAAAAAATAQAAQLTGELAQAQADATHAGQLADAGRDLLRQELARLIDQVGELKAALYKRVAVADASPTSP